MSEAANFKLDRHQKRKRRVIVVSGSVAVLCFWFAGLRINERDPLFRGKPESEWIKNLTYAAADTRQTEEWRSYGEEGVQVLIRGLRRANRSAERVYRRFYRLLPALVTLPLPYPKEDSTCDSRQLICGLISRLGKDARSAIPVMARSLRDEDFHVRLSALTFFGWPPNGEAVLSLMNEKEKAKILPDLFQVMQESPSARLNGLSALKYFPEQKGIVTPVLLANLQDENSAPRVLAAYALHCVDLMAAKNAGALAIVVEIAKNPTNASAAYAVRMLGKFNHEPEAAVPALVECLQSADSLIVCEAVWALEWAPQEFKRYTNNIVPVLARVAERKDHVGKYATVALKRFQFESDHTKGTK